MVEPKTPFIMKKDKFLTNFFRIITILTPIVMLLIKMVDKKFRGIEIEIAAISIYVMLVVFLIGFIKGVSLKEQEKSTRKGIRDG